MRETVLDTERVGMGDVEVDGDSKGVKIDEELWDEDKLAVSE